MKIAFLSSEVYPFSKTGGLADVSAGLPKALSNKYIDIKVFTPYYKCAERFQPEYIPNSRIPIQIGDKIFDAELYQIKYPNSNLIVYFVGNPEFYFREHLYGIGNEDYTDNFSRFTFFTRAVLEYLRFFNWIPDIIHTNDWQTALAPAYLATVYKPYFPNTKTVFTIHNIAYQGLFWVWDMKISGLPFTLFNWQQLEYYGKMNLLKGGIVFSDIVTTVSPTYAREILLSEYSYGLNTVLNEYKHKLFGIVNGVDYEEWSPEIDSLLPAQYSKDDLAGKKINKNKLCELCNFPIDDTPVFGFVGRLVEQKGVKIIADAINELMSKQIRIVVLGSGDKYWEGVFTDFNNRFPDKFRTFIKFDNKLAHLIEAGADVFLMPSLFEPCGLNQLYSLKYGTPPLVRYTGGLADTVIDTNQYTIDNNQATGFVFKNIDHREFLYKIDEILKYYYTDVWQKIIKTAMQQDWSWSVSAQKYIDLYKSLLTR